MSQFCRNLFTLLKILVVGLTLNSFVECRIHEPVVRIEEQGALRGKVSESRTGRQYLEFLGIPYAKSERFQLPGPAPKWEGTRDATRFRNRCLQYDRKLRGVSGNEDCLYLNVFTPVYSDPKHKRLPVMIFIHGGSFMFNSGIDYSPKYLMDHDIIIITFNFRLGALGFLTTLDRQLPANLGMRDQVAALTWVKKNINHFGGDEGRITLMGAGSGATSVTFHMISPMSKGLFHRAVSLSGNALCPSSLSRSPLDVTKILAKSLSSNCLLANSYTISACLKHADARELIEKQQELTGWKTEAPAILPFAPVIESSHSIMDGIPIFLPDSPTKLFRDGKFQNIPWISGVNSADGVTYTTADILNSTQMMKYVEANWTEFAPLAFVYKETAPNPRTVSQKIRDYYFGTEGKINSDSGKINLINALSDRNFFRCTKNSALLYARHSKVWVYYFTMPSNSSILEHYGIPHNLGLKGVVHSDQLQYIFLTKWFPEIHVNNTKYFNFSQSLIRLLVSFAADGQPTKLWGKVNKWEALPPTEIKPESFIKMLQIDENTNIIDEPFRRLAFWDKLRLQSAQTTKHSDQVGEVISDVNSGGITFGINPVEIYIKILILLPLTLFFIC